MALTPSERKRVKQAVVTLSRYKKPFITRFVKGQPKPTIPVHKHDKKELCALIEKILLGEYRGSKRYVIESAKLIEYLDDRQETGRQHIYLFRLPEQRRDNLLERLRDFEKVKALLGGKDEIYQAGSLVWEARRGPQLALVRHEQGPTPPRSLLLKWVETRAYWVPKHSEEAIEFAEQREEQQELTETDEVEDAAGTRDEETIETEETEEPEEIEEVEGTEDVGEIERVKVSVRLEERAVTFLVIDLHNGDCELRIQALRGSARATRQKQLATYRNLLAKLFGFEPSGPTVLAPAIRRALIAREVGILFCSAILPEGGQFIGEEGEFPPVDVRQLEAGLAIGFNWRQPKSGLARIELDGRLDEIFVVKPMVPEQHRLLLNRIRRWRHEGLADLSSSVESKPMVSNDAAPPPVTYQAATQPVTTGKPTTTQAGRAIAILSAALKSGVQPEQPTVEPGIDRAIREYTRTHPVEDPAGTTTPPRREAKRHGPAPPPTGFGDERPLEQFLTYIKEVASSERSTYEREIKLVRNEEKWNFRLYIAAAILALAIVVTGACLLPFVSAKLTIAGITALLGVLTGRGTWLIRSYDRSLKAKRSLIQEQQRDSHETLVMIQMALSIPDPQERSNTMSSVATKLLERLSGSARSPKESRDEKASRHGDD